MWKEVSAVVVLRNAVDIWMPSKVHTWSTTLVEPRLNLEWS
jgi:hypothetical protein